MSHNHEHDHGHDWERYSARQDTKMKMGGFVGDVFKVVPQLIEEIKKRKGA